ncbi:uncharacterized protein MELLADRAFT_55346 [Melampsora larici-populina 98AG31]|uniref:Uncharacterized protein n=1 Tax=Melampsora larici-populina (strain 98AG31 / pathotype 3-4-7) TaxID=747676 RepID=F4RDI6_MELLP|nr:uncharacterized protein MELLADRAFT_55346 [Melampsora larici-populina 98AG31]EGG09408.1 hypothetical protein MELLADRAFT_55346 [Melampsora larici-populina 98AG31]
MKSTIHDFIAFAPVPKHEVDDVTVAFEDHSIYTFYPFLFPRSFDARDMERWGISLGTGLALMDSARRFYQHLVDIGEEKSRLNGIVIPDSDSDAEIKVMSSKSKPSAKSKATSKAKTGK